MMLKRIVEAVKKNGALMGVQLAFQGFQVKFAEKAQDYDENNLRLT